MGNCGKSREIAGNCGKFNYKNNGDHCFEKSRGITSQRVFKKNNCDHFGGQILALIGDHLLCDCMTFFFYLSYRGGGGSGAGVLFCITPSLYQIFY